MLCVTKTIVFLRLLPEPQEQQVHLVARERVERAEGLVHQEHGGVLRERPHDRRPLLHAAGELARVRLLEADEAGLVEELRDPRLVRLSPLDLEWELEVLPQVAPREEVRLLEDHPDLARARPGHRRAVEQHPPAGQGVKAGHRPQERRLAAAARTEDADELTVAHADRDVLERVHHARSSSRRPSSHPRRGS